MNRNRCSDRTDPDRPPGGESADCLARMPLSTTAAGLDAALLASRPDPACGRPCATGLAGSARPPSTATAAASAASDGIRSAAPAARSASRRPQRSSSRQALQYGQLIRQAAAQKALAPADHPETVRLRRIAARLVEQSTRFNPRAAKWQWEVNLIGSRQINAFCMPGGKIAFFSGILDTLQADRRRGRDR